MSNTVFNRLISRLKASMETNYNWCMVPLIAGLLFLILISWYWKKDIKENKVEALAKIIEGRGTRIIVEYSYKGEIYYATTKPDENMKLYLGDTLAINFSSKDPENYEIIWDSAKAWYGSR